MTFENNSHPLHAVSEKTAPAPWGWKSMPVHAEQQMSLDAAYEYCLALSRSHYENFPVMLSIFPRRQQRALSAVYAFARMADDFADESCFAAWKQASLAWWREELERCYTDKASHPVFIALKDTITSFPIEKELLMALLDAFVQDCSKTRYQDWDEVLDYCRRSANPVGRIVLRILGSQNTENDTRSDAICTALQLANFWQDISVDAKKNRIYLPLKDLQKFELTPEDVLSATARPGFTPLIAEMVQRTEALFEEGKPLLKVVSWQGRMYLTAVHLGGTTILDMVRRLGPKAVTIRPKLGMGSVARHYIFSLFKRK